MFAIKHSPDEQDHHGHEKISGPGQRNQLTLYVSKLVFLNRISVQLLYPSISHFPGVSSLRRRNCPRYHWMTGVRRIWLKRAPLNAVRRRSSRSSDRRIHGVCRQPRRSPCCIDPIYFRSPLTPSSSKPSLEKVSGISFLSLHFLWGTLIEKGAGDSDM